jgi:GNAT superfamily N-acetyltransferase
MNEKFHVVRHAELTGTSIEDLRGAVGWDRMDGLYDRILARSYTHFSISEPTRLAGFLNVISDGIADACLLDLMVHPEVQRQGLGRALLACAVQELAAEGIQMIQVVFNPVLEPFYRRCGFDIIKAGVIDRKCPGQVRSNE